MRRNGKFFFHFLCCVMVATTVTAQDVSEIQVVLSNGTVLGADGNPVGGADAKGAIRVLPFPGGSVVATARGELIGVGGATPFAGVNLKKEVMKDFVLLPDASGGYFVDIFGGIHPVGSAQFFGSTFYGSPFNPLPISADLELAFDLSGNVQGYYQLSTNGEIRSFGAVPQLNGVRVRSAVSLRISPNGDGYAVLNAQGQLFAFGNSPVVDISVEIGVGNHVVDFSYSASGQGYYLLDQRGIIHAAGDAVPILNQLPVEGAFPVAIYTGVQAGSVENLPDDIFPVPTATHTPTERPVATSTSTHTPTATRTPTATFTSTSVPVPATNTPTQAAPTPTHTALPVSSPTNTPVTGETPSVTPTATATGASPITPTSTPVPPTSTPLPPTATPTVTPTSTPVPTATQSGQIQWAGRWRGTFTSFLGNRSNAEFNVVLLPNGFIEVTDVNGNVFGRNRVFTGLPLPPLGANVILRPTDAAPGSSEGINLAVDGNGVLTGLYSAAATNPTAAGALELRKV